MNTSPSLLWWKIEAVATNYALTSVLVEIRTVGRASDFLTSAGN